MEFSSEVSLYLWHARRLDLEPGVNKALTKKAQVSEAGESHVNVFGFMEHTSYVGGRDEMLQPRVLLF